MNFRVRYTIFISILLPVLPRYIQCTIPSPQTPPPPHVAYHIIKGNHKILLRTEGMGSERQNSTFSEQPHVANQINILKGITNAALGPGDGVNRSKVNFFRTQNMVMLPIRLKGIIKNLLQSPPPPDPSKSLPPPTLGTGSKANFFRTWSCCISD